MIKVEQDLLVLDSSFTKDDVLAINEFIEIAKAQEKERIIKLLEDYLPKYYQLSPNSDAAKYPIEAVIEIIKGEAR